MEFRKNSKYAIVAPTSMGLRMTPKMRQPVHISLDYDVQVTSAESNVLSVPAALGLRTKVYTKFVKDNPSSKLIKQDLQRRNIAYAGEAVPQGGPWGYRHQINIADSGYGMRGPSVWNDRAGEIGATLSPEDFPCNRFFRKKAQRYCLLQGLSRRFPKKQARYALPWRGRQKKTEREFALTSTIVLLFGQREKRNYAVFFGKLLGCLIFRWQILLQQKLVSG